MSDIYARMKEKRDIWYAMDRSNNEERMMAEEYEIVKYFM